VRVSSGGNGGMAAPPSSCIARTHTLADSHLIFCISYY
jgi:hypothetical protein